LLEGDDEKNYEYRVVFQGNRFIDRSRDVALFQNLGSVPLAMEARSAASLDMMLN
jgi:hypothetical protein